MDVCHVVYSFYFCSGKPVLKQQAYMRLSKDPKPVPIDIESYLKRKQTFRRLRRARRRRAALKIPPAIILTTPERKHKFLYYNKHTIQPKKKLRLRKPRRHEPTPDMLMEDGPQETKVSSPFTMANLMIYVFFGAIMYVKV